MTRGNAHQYLKKVYLTTKNDSYREALSIALSALRPITREQVKKMRGEWKHRFTTDDSVFCTSCKTTFRAYYDEYNFCPDCGAPMTYEAVDILWKRLEEALKDGN